MITTKKILIFSTLILCNTDGLAATFKSENGIDETSGKIGPVCYVYDRGWPDNDSFWYCGKQNKKCDGVKDYSDHCTSGCIGGDTAHWLEHGQSFSRDGNTYWCCNGSKEKRGIFVKSDQWTTQTLKTISIGNGNQCSYYITQDVCGNIISDEPCSQSDSCDAGYIKRNGECVQPCDAPLVFESITSNKCIQCEQTPYQKATTDNKGASYCLKCDKDTQFIKTEIQTLNLTPSKITDTKFIKTLNKLTPSITTSRVVVRCASKSEFKQISTTDMKKCWRCNGTENFKKCLNGETPHKFCPEDYTDGK